MTSVSGAPAHVVTPSRCLRSAVTRQLPVSLSERCQPQEGPVFDERSLYHLITFGTRYRRKSPIRR